MSESIDPTTPGEVKKVFKLSAEVDNYRLQLLTKIKDHYDGDFSGFGVGSLGEHEARHTTSLAINNVEKFLTEHPSVVQDPEKFALANAALGALYLLYQSFCKKED